MKGPAPPKERKTRVLHLRLDLATEVTIKSKAAEAGMSVSQYVRTCCCGSTIRSSNAALLYHLNRIANSLHEIAGQAQARRGVDLAVLQSLLAVEHMVMAL